MYVIEVRNVNEALAKLPAILDAPTDRHWREIAPRGLLTLEMRAPVTTVYERPTERVLFDAVRDCNPFFQFFESLWILAGRNDVAYLEQYTSQMGQFSDDGKFFHAAYGFRLRKHFTEGLPASPAYDQILEVIDLLRRDPDTRQAVMSIWDPVADLNNQFTKDVPCNDLITFKLRAGVLDMTVMCRSNDVILGAYGTNAVQFSMIQEFVARSVGAQVGKYRQVSDSFHVYTDSQPLKRIMAREQPVIDWYARDVVTPYPIMDATTGDPEEWLGHCELFCDGGNYIRKFDPFFIHVAQPLRTAWKMVRDDECRLKQEKIVDAVNYISANCHASDWKMACMSWLNRRRKL